MRRLMTLDQHLIKKIAERAYADGRRDALRQAADDCPWIGRNSKAYEWLRARAEQDTP